MQRKTKMDPPPDQAIRDVALVRSESSCGVGDSSWDGEDVLEERRPALFLELLARASTWHVAPFDIEYDREDLGEVERLGELGEEGRDELEGRRVLGCARAGLVGGCPSLGRGEEGVEYPVGGDGDFSSMRAGDGRDEEAAEEDVGEGRVDVGEGCSPSEPYGCNESCLYESELPLEEPGGLGRGGRAVGREQVWPVWDEAQSCESRSEQSDELLWGGDVG